MRILPIFNISVILYLKCKNISNFYFELIKISYNGISNAILSLLSIEEINKFSHLYFMKM